jgi:hypothetical protein
MKQTLLFVMLLPVIASAQNNIVSGNWREVKRTDIKGSPISFHDTIKLSFLANDQYSYVRDGGFLYKGGYKVTDNKLDMGARNYDIVSTGERRLVIKDDGNIYEFAPYTPPVPKLLRREENSTELTSADKVHGKWKVYKRKSSEQLKEVDYTSLVKSIMILNHPDSVGNIGYLFASKDAEGQPSWKITRIENGTIYVDGKSKRVFSAKQAGKDLVIEEGSIAYFLKQFKE